MTKQLTFVLFLAFATTLIGQNKISVTILDGETKAPVSNVNVKVKGSKKGFVSNHEGKFDITSNDKLNDSSVLLISHIQYFTEEISVGAIKEHNYIIHLLSSRYLLEEIVLNSKKKKRQAKTLVHQKVTTLPIGLSNFDAFVKDDDLTIVGGMILAEVENWDQIADKDQWIEIGGPDFQQILTQTVFSNNWKSYNANVYRFNLENNNWSSDKKKTIKRAFHNVHLVNDKLYIVGGKRLSRSENTEYLENRIEVLNYKDNSVIVDKVNPHKAANFASFLHKNKLIVMGGSIKQKSNGDKEFNNKVHFQDLKTGLWYELGNMPIAKETQGVVINESIYLIGGNNNKPVKNIESYNLKTGKWKKEGELFNGMEQPGLATLNGVVYIYDQGIILTYDTQTKRLNKYKTNLALSAPKILLHKDKLYVIGGIISSNYRKFSSNGVYTIDLKQFVPEKIIDSKLL